MRPGKSSQGRHERQETRAIEQRSGKNGLKGTSITVTVSITYGFPLFKLRRHSGEIINQESSSI